MLYLELFLQGLVQGSIYALIAIGLTLVYGLLRILHIAHAGLFTLGGYIGVLVTNGTGSLIFAIAVAVLVVGLFGIAIYRGCYRPLLRQPPFVALIASIGLFIAMQEIFRMLFGPYGLSYTNPPLQSVVRLLSANFRVVELVTIVASVVSICVLEIVASRTRIGIAWRATITEPEIAESFGVDIDRVRDLNFFMGSALAGVAGVMVALLNNLVEPTMGSVASYKALAIIVLGGLGNVQGALIAALALGIVESYGTIYLGSWIDRDAIAFAFLIFVLMLRPQGLMGRP